MFKVGDIVRIKHMDDAMEGSPADNLEGSIVEITSATYFKKNTPKYAFKFIEKHAKNEEKCHNSDNILAWENEHFELVEQYKEIGDMDISSLLRS